MTPPHTRDSASLAALALPPPPRQRNPRRDRSPARILEVVMFSTDDGAELARYNLTQDTAFLPGPRFGHRPTPNLHASPQGRSRSALTRSPGKCRRRRRDVFRTPQDIYHPYGARRRGSQFTKHGAADFGMIAPSRRLVPAAKNPVIPRLFAYSSSRSGYGSAPSEGSGLDTPALFFGLRRAGPARTRAGCSRCVSAARCRASTVEPSFPRGRGP